MIMKSLKEKSGKELSGNLGILAEGERLQGFPSGSVVNNLPAMQEMWVPGRSFGEGNGNPLQYSCPDNSMDRGAWWATVHRVAKRQT